MSLCPSLPPRALAALAFALGLVVVATGCIPRPTVAELDRKLYRTSLATFDRWWRGEQAAANRVSRSTVDRWLATSPGRLDTAATRSRPWDVSTDLCSFAPDRGLVFDFRIPCVRHDFAWRNLRRLGRTRRGVDTRERRSAANAQFRRDMESTCAGRSAVQRPACRAVARTYYEAVSAVS